MKAYDMRNSNKALTVKKKTESISSPKRLPKRLLNRLKTYAWSSACLNYENQKSVGDEITAYKISMMITKGKNANAFSRWLIKDFNLKNKQKEKELASKSRVISLKYLNVAEKIWPGTKKIFEIGPLVISPMKKWPWIEKEVNIPLWVAMAGKEDEIVEAWKKVPRRAWKWWSPWRFPEVYVSQPYESFDHFEWHFEFEDDEIAEIKLNNGERDFINDLSKNQLEGDQLVEYWHWEGKKLIVEIGENYYDHRWQPFTKHFHNGASVCRLLYDYAEHNENCYKTSPLVSLAARLSYSRLQGERYIYLDEELFDFKGLAAELGPLGITFEDIAEICYRINGFEIRGNNSQNCFSPTCKIGEIESFEERFNNS
nr:hypothetical protein [uncultured Desulfobacter sp.]